MSKKKTTEEFIRESKEKFGEGKFRYDNTVYKDSKTDLIITCPKHGDFKVRPDNHLCKGSNGGCRECMKEFLQELFSSNTKEFIRRSKEKFGEGKFRYDNTVYTNNRTNVIITCPKHGDFKILPDNHLREGSNGGCRECKKEFLQELFSSNTKEFIEKSKKLYGDKFSYDKTIYVNSKTDVIITCKKHGDFKTSPGHHLTPNRKGGCEECRREYLRKIRSSNTKEFIEKSKKLYGDKFGYDKTIYVDVFTDVIITCPKHGDFKVKPSTHLNKYGCGGCPKCNSSKLEDEIRKLLTENGIRFREQEPFSWLIGPNGGPQTLDFYLPDLGIGIECQGEQHFRAVKHFGGEKKLKYTQECDQNKLKLCEEHGIKLIYYSNLSTPDKPFDYPYSVYEDGAKLVEKLMSMLNDDTDAEDTAQN
jgi:hypothetical protein